MLKKCGVIVSDKKIYNFMALILIFFNLIKLEKSINFDCEAPFTYIVLL